MSQFNGNESAKKHIRRYRYRKALRHETRDVYIQQWVTSVTAFASNKNKT